jgi:hypothetical protein
MSKELAKEIIKHIYKGFGISSKTKSIISKEYLLDKKITFVEDELSEAGTLYGCQLSAGDQEVKVIVADASYEQYGEFYMIVHLKGAPYYGLSFSFNHYVLGYSIDGKGWDNCSVYLQGTFLAAMEQLKESHLNWNKCYDYQDENDSLPHFVEFSENQREDV